MMLFFGGVAKWHAFLSRYGKHVLSSGSYPTMYTFDKLSLRLKNIFAMLERLDGLNSNRHNYEQTVFVIGMGGL